MLLNFYNSLLVTIQSNFAYGPIYFHCYPNYSMNINNKNIIDTLTLNFKSNNMNSKDITRKITIIYTIYYKLMKTIFGLKAKMVSNKKATILMETYYNNTLSQI